MPIKKTVLVVDDNPVNRSILCRILSSEYQTAEAANGAEALALLRDEAPEISAVMLDIIMPVMDGYRFLEEVSQNPDFSDVPVIVTTGNSDNENEKKALRLGAWDFVSKPYDAEIIRFRLKNVIARSRLSALQQLQYLTEYDELTGIYNKTKFFAETRRMLDAYPEQHFAFVRFDIDRFQLINSFFGSEEGDRLLCYIARELQKKAMQIPLCAYGRIEADVFGICLAVDQLRDVAAELEGARSLFTGYNLNYNIVPSFGICRITDPTQDVSAIFDCATLAAKCCKENHINFYAYYNEEMSQKLIRAQEITNEMDAALRNEEFEVYIQPKYSLQNDEPVGGEALVRWQHPEKGLISPGEFIPIFERNGFISKLDHYMWEKVCALLRRWMDEGLEPHPISVNVSRVNLYNPNLVEIIYGLVCKYQIPPALLNLELTESAYTDNPEAMRTMIARLQELGFVIMMDDFGSGYSSLNILKDIAVDVLKIDMRFLSATEIEGRGENIIASVVRMAKWLSIPVIMEGVEIKSQVDFLRSIHCDYVQGFYFARPMPAAEFEAFQKKRKEKLPVQLISHKSTSTLNELWSSAPEEATLFGNFVQPAAVYEFSGDQIELVRMNDAFYDFFGHADKVYTTNRPLELVREDCRDVLIHAFRRAVALENTAECEYARYRFDGSMMWVRIVLKYINRVGESALLFGVLSDITIQKRVDEELARYRTAAVGSRPGKPIMLIVDDAETSREILREMFRLDYFVIEADDGESALSILEEQHYAVDIILLDLIMPKIGGKEFLRRKQEIPEMIQIPVVIITADSTIEAQLKTMTLGASDYVMKPFVPEVVMRRVKNVFESSKQLHRAFCELPSEAQTTDALTGLLSRAETEKQAEALLLECPRAAMLLLDLDEFGEVNRRLGHTGGDALLCAVATALQGCAEDAALLGRVGGDEFLLLLPGVTDSDEVTTLCTRLKAVLGAVRLPGFEQKTRCSGGYVLAPRHGTDFATLFRNAEKALYAAKQNGKHRMEPYQGDH